jgi:hypothetical protein
MATYLQIADLRGDTDFRARVGQAINQSEARMKRRDLFRLMLGAPLVKVAPAFQARITTVSIVHASKITGCLRSSAIPPVKAIVP